MLRWVRYRRCLGGGRVYPPRSRGGGGRVREPYGLRPPGELLVVSTMNWFRFSSEVVVLLG